MILDIIVQLTKGGMETALGLEVSEPVLLADWEAKLTPERKLKVDSDALAWGNAVYHHLATPQHKWLGELDWAKVNAAQNEYYAMIERQMVQLLKRRVYDYVTSEGTPKHDKLGVVLERYFKGELGLFHEYVMHESRYPAGKTGTYHLLQACVLAVNEVATAKLNSHGKAVAKFAQRVHANVPALPVDERGFSV